MSRLALADRKQIRAIYAESHRLWGAGLSLRDYTELWYELNEVPWAKRHARFVVWLDDRGHVLSSLKIYRPRVRVGGRATRCSVLGAVFTPRARRGQGHATRMLETVIDRGRRSGERLAMLFSDIGTGYYESLGFVALPADEHWGPIPRRPGEVPGDWGVRASRPEDLAEIRDAHHASCLRRPLALLRDEDHWEFLLRRTTGFFKRLRDPAVHAHCRVVTRREQFLGYLITVEGRGDWSVREFGAVGGDPQTTASVLRAGAAHALRAGLRRFHGWIPPEIQIRLADWELKSQKRPRAIPMVLVRDSSIVPDRLADPERAFLPYLDQF
jgi:predicted N-acetyltransferase YhbS